MERLTEWIDKNKAIPKMDMKRNGHQRCMNKLAKLEDMEEQGKLLILPCKPGDTVYAYCKELHKILSYFVEQVVIDYDPDNTNGYVTINCNCVENNELIDCIDFEPKEVGIKVFLTEQEAKEALEEMKNEI